ncbi:hypothetical protein E0Z10_g5764 [Xylaria hypoxylon]|uniref:Uncharacterized protein n=1 Tax=Xylaria hypoxylon TaxID=37992 RepID=A0A4Z0YFB7_9PEZI|nr:hypothetical protein E0Z10_g5764 [Xylaria hypoxylon]
MLACMRFAPGYWRCFTGDATQTLRGLSMDSTGKAEISIPNAGISLYAYDSVANPTDTKTGPESGTTSAAQVSPQSSLLVRFGDSTPIKGTAKAKKAKKESADTNANCEIEASRLIGGGQPQDAVTGAAKAKKKLAKIFTISPGPTSSRTTTAATSPSGVEGPFRDPMPESKGTKAKLKKEKRKRKGKATASLESLGSAQDPFQDPEPMQLIDADDFRLEPLEDASWPIALPPDMRVLGFRKQEDEDEKRRKRT